MMIDPCKCCKYYPRLCNKLCSDKKAYMESIEDVEVHTKARPTKIVDVNKNGIRRER